jgi:hypothetical protein
MFQEHNVRRHLSYSDHDKLTKIVLGLRHMLPWLPWTRSTVSIG